jgi:Zn-dependent protease
MLERISRKERLDLLIAWVAISLAFTIINIAPGGFLGFHLKIDPLEAILVLGISFITVGIAFVFHELAHKFTAIKFGFWAEFRKDNTMLLVAVALAALVGMVFAAPGATLIDTGRFGGFISREQNGKISAAGPLVNLLLCIPFFIIFMLCGAITAVRGGDVCAQIGLAGIRINAMIAAFNMLPISVLDGRKVVAWNAGIFIILIAAAFGILLLSFNL